MSDEPKVGDEVRFADTASMRAAGLAGTRGVVTCAWVSGFNQMVRVQRIGGPFEDDRGVVDLSSVEVELIK